jgi:hypothetical protein
MIQEDTLKLIQKLQNLKVPHMIDELLDLFNDDAQYQFVGHSNLVGKQEIRKVFEYDLAANAELRFINFVPHGHGVVCQLSARNDRLKAIGIDELFYTSCVITLEEGRIQKFIARAEEETSHRITQRIKAFIAWLAREHPAEFSMLCTPGGDLIINAENGRRGVPLMIEWWASVQR